MELWRKICLSLILRGLCLFWPADQLHDYFISCDTSVWVNTLFGSVIVLIFPSFCTFRGRDTHLFLFLTHFYRLLESVASKQQKTSKTGSRDSDNDDDRKKSVQRRKADASWTRGEEGESSAPPPGDLVVQVWKPWENERLTSSRAPGWTQMFLPLSSVWNEKLSSSFVFAWWHSPCLFFFILFFLCQHTVFAAQEEIANFNTSPSPDTQPWWQRFLKLRVKRWKRISFVHRGAEQLIVAGRGARMFYFHGYCRNAACSWRSNVSEQSIRSPLVWTMAAMRSWAVC